MKQHSTLLLFYQLLERLLVMTTVTVAMPEATVARLMIGDRRATKFQLNQCPKIDRILVDDTVIGCVHIPYKEDLSQSYYIVVRERSYLRLPFNSPTTRIIDYKSYAGGEFMLEYGLSTSAHQLGYHQFKNKVLKKNLPTFLL